MYEFLRISDKKFSSAGEHWENVDRVKWRRKLVSLSRRRKFLFLICCHWVGFTRSSWQTLLLYIYTRTLLQNYSNLWWKQMNQSLDSTLFVDRVYFIIIIIKKRWVDETKGHTRTYRYVSKRQKLEVFGPVANLGIRAVYVYLCIQIKVIDMCLIITDEPMTQC